MYSMEKWKCFIKNSDEKMKRYSGFLSISYFVSNFGNIKIQKEKKDGTIFECKMKGICRQYKNKGYLSFRIRNKSYRVHRLVAEYFVDGYSKYKNVVNHIDSNELNNNYLNLEWVSTKDNIRYSYKKGKAKRAINEETIKMIKKYMYSDTIKNLSKKFNCSKYIIADIRRKKIYQFDL